MTEKRFTRISVCGDWGIKDSLNENVLFFATTDEVLDTLNVLNVLNDENEQLKFQLQNTCDQRDEFHRGARENANRVGELKKENDELKKLLKEQNYEVLDTIQSLSKENKELKQYKQSVRDILLNWSQKNLAANQLQVIIAIMEELNVGVMWND